MLAFLDPFAGISGDMLLGALIDCGWPLERLQAVVAQLGLEGVRVEAAPVVKQGIAGTYVQVIAPHEHAHRGRDDLAGMIARAGFAPEIEERAIAVIDALAAAESRVHGVPVDQIHFHEVGAVDSLVDMVGAVAGLRDLGVTEVRCGPLPWSQGFVETAHGRLPVPPPAVAALLEGLPVVGVDLRGEMVTPTGAALARALASGFGPIAPMRVARVGYGAGTREWPDRPNLLRLVLGQPLESPESAGGPSEESKDGLIAERLWVLACNLDDMNPQWYGPLLDTLLAAGALDVWLTPAQMKKNRPATVLEVLCKPPDGARLRDLLLRHSTTLGLRQYEVERWSVARQIHTLTTPYGPVRVKVGRLPGGDVKVMPEHDDCAARAAEHGLSVREVWQAALEQAARQTFA